MAVKSGARANEKRISKRVNWAFVPIAAAYGLLLFRLGYIQIHLGKALHDRAVKERSTTIVVPPRRGTILDRNDHPLAVSVYSGSLCFDPVPLVKETDPKQLAANQKKLDYSIAMVSDVLSMKQEDVRALVVRAEAEAIEAGIRKSHPKRSYIVRKDVPLETANLFRTGRADLSKKVGGVIGFGLVDGSKRQYSSGSASMQVIGYVSDNDKPLSGMEWSCQKWLVGSPGSLRAEVDRQNKVLPETVQTRKPVLDGDDVHTSIDPYAQHLAMEEAQKIYDQYHPRGGVSIVIVDPSTGDLLALASTPTLDPNPEERHRLSINPVTDDRLMERCASVLYEPGSTLKALTVASALQDGTIDMNSRFSCSGALKVGNKSIHCPVYGPWDAHGHGSVNCREILRHSCNVGAAQIGMKMGPYSLVDGDTRFGLFDPLEIELPYTRTGLLSYSHTEHIYTMAKAARIAFGHSMVTTPLHVAMAYAAIANGGKLMHPRLVTEITDARGNIVKTTKPQMIRQVISASISADMTDMLCDVVEKGTGKTGAVRGYRVAGKTGTAKKYQPGKYTASFIGYLPASPKVQPKVVILVVVDEPQAGPHYGAQVAAPAFHSIAGQLMSYYKIPEDDPTDSQFKTASMGLRHDHDAPHSAASHVTAL